MAGKSNIEWTEQTWNPIVGCSIVSPGCTNCYAMKMAARIEAMKSSHYDGTTKRVNGNAVWTGKLALAPESILLAPVKRKTPTIYFVNSMGDLFHEDAREQDIDNVMAIMGACEDLGRGHTFQVLTKRAERMRDYMRAPRAYRAWNSRRLGTEAWPPRNLWLGVSAERQQEADERIPLLLQTPAAVRFVSAEPLLGAIDLSDRLTFHHEIECDHIDGQRRGLVPRARLDWLIVGGESGPNARPMHPDWARSLRDQCAAAGVPFFFKQWGNWACKHDRDVDDPDWRDSATVAQWPNSQWLNLAGGQGFHGQRVVRVQNVGKKSAGRLLDGIEHSAMPKVTA